MAGRRPVRLGLERGNLLVVATGSLAAARLPGQVEAIRGWYPDTSVRVLVTAGALQFVTPVMLRMATGQAVHGPDWYDGARELTVPHRQLAAWADAVVVLPATGNTVSKLAAGLADNLALATVQDAECPVVVVPSVSPGVLARPLFGLAVERLRQAGFVVMDPVEGRRASDGSTGPGAPAALPDVLMTLAGAVSARRAAAPSGGWPTDDLLAGDPPAGLAPRSAVPASRAAEAS
jgi:phosphopantothenoylcysteine decarboxylase / phosphopantothenate---cysteine ligase